MTRLLWIGLIAGLLIGPTGCRSTSNRHSWCRKEAPARPVYVAPPPPTVLQTQGQAFPTSPPAGAFVVPPPGANIVQPAQPGVAPSISKAPPEKVEIRWQGPAGPRESREPTTQRDVPPGVRLYAPEPLDTESNQETPKKKSTVPSSFPSIAEFATVKDKMYAGLRPPLDGLDWLAADGVRTIVNVRLFGEDDSTDRQQVEARKMRYVAFEVSPQTLTRERAEEFIRLVRGGSVFVYDRDGSLAGSMWYLYQRLGELHDDDAAQLRSRPLGLQTNRDGQHRDMWLAVQKVLAENSR